MKISVPKEIKNSEYRVGLTPSSVKTLVKDGNEIYVETGAGAEIGFSDKDYIDCGAKVVETQDELYTHGELIIKVKEPTPDEFKYLNNKHTLFAYLHLAADKDQSNDLIKTGVTGIALETITAENGTMPLLAPMSKIAGRIGVVVGSYFLLKPQKGIGVLLGGVDQIEPRTVTIVGAGVAGEAAIRQARDNGSHVKVLDLSMERLNQLKSQFNDDNIEYIYSDQNSIADTLKDSDLVIGSVYVVGKEAPKVIEDSMLNAMKRGAVLVDISIDQGGCIETSRPTTHDNPTFIHKDKVHYCVTNMPGAVPLTSSLALNKATIPYIRKLAMEGIEKCLKNDIHIYNGLNMKNGDLIHPAIKESLLS